jgi:diguanylate cyclase (GGDEF)-like protein/PAS domain S-box-containing protein
MVNHLRFCLHEQWRPCYSVVDLCPLCRFGFDDPLFPDFHISLFAIFIIPIVTIIISLTNDFHGLMIKDIHYSMDGPLLYVDAVTYGAYFWVHTIYSYLVVLLAIVLLLQTSVRSFRLYRRQAVTVALAVIPTIITSVIDAFLLIPALKHALSPFGFTLMGIIFFDTIYRHQFLNVIPIARDMLIESMSDAMIVLNAQDRIVDINPAAQQLFQVKTASIIGSPIQKALPQWRDLLDLDKDHLLTQTSIDFDLGETVYHYDLRISPIYNRNKQAIGRLIILRDITSLKQLEKELFERNTILKTQLKEINRLHQQLQEQVIRDPLTGLFNRRYLNETLQHEIASVKREGHPLSVLMIDIDHFKRINDTYGHVNGDVVLITLSNHLVGKVRGSDMVYRYGGEEFLILMRNTTVENACQRAEALRASIEDLEIRINDRTEHLTISIGVATYPLHSAELQKVIEAADTALYRAKAGGRNRTAAAMAK